MMGYARRNYGWIGMATVELNRGDGGVSGTCLWREACLPHTALHSTAQLGTFDPGSRQRTGISSALTFPFSMAGRPSRPLPTPPGPVNPLGGWDHDHIYSIGYELFG